MKNQKLNTIRTALILVSIIMPVINLIGILSIDSLAGLMIEGEVIGRIDEISSNSLIRFLNQILPSFIMGTLFVLYLIPLFRSLWNFQDTSNEEAGLSRKTIRSILNLPFFAALLTSFGWMLGAPVVPIAAPFYQVSLDLSFNLQYFLHSFVLFGFSFVLSYYATEVIARTMIIPQCLQENDALDASAQWSLSIPTRLIVFAATAFLFPIIILLTGIIILNNGGENSFQRDMIPLLLIGIPVISIMVGLVTWLKSVSIAEPVRKLAEAAREVEKGNFSRSVTASSGDEIGQLTGAFNSMVKGLAERERMKGLFGKVVDPRVRDSMLAGSSTGEQGEERDAAVVFFDLAGFTGLSEVLEPRQLVKVLNWYFEAVTSSVEHFDGMVNKFIGDGVLAVFGVPLEAEDKERKALQAVQLAMRKLIKLNKQLQTTGTPKLSLRAGIHSGKVLAGIIGTKDRMEYTVIGDAVNIASRLESMGKELEAPIVVSADTIYNALDSAGIDLGEQHPRSIRIGSLVFTDRGDSVIRGRQTKLSLYSATMKSKQASA
jgi:class 3 adenylate cyclase